MKILSALIVVICLFSGVAIAQTVPLDQKTWYTMSTRGAPPPAWGAGWGVLPLQSYVENNGLINPAGNACMQAADLNCQALMAPGAGAIWNIRVMDGDGATLADVHATDGTAVPNSDDALEVLGLNYGWEPGSTTWITIDASLSSPTAIPSTLNTLNVASNLYVYDSGAGITAQKRVTTREGAGYQNFTLINGPQYDVVPIDVGAGLYGHDGGAPGNMVLLHEVMSSATYPIATTPALVVASALYAFDSVGAANMSRLIQTTPADATTAAAALNVENFNMAWDATNSHWDRVRSDVNGALIVNQSTTVPGYGRIQDGDSTVLADVEDANADAKALTLNPLMTASVMYLYNGATIDMARNGAVKELQMTDVASRPGEDSANDWRKTKKQEIAVWTPAKEASGDIVAAATVVLASKEVVSWPNCCIYYRNKDAAVHLTDAALYTSPDNAGTCGDANWAQISWNDCETLADGATCVYCFSEMAYRYVCGTASAAANPNDVDSVETWITCNKS